MLYENYNKHKGSYCAPCWQKNSDVSGWKSFHKQHQKLSDLHYNKYQRDPETRKRYGWAWKRIRDRYIRNNPLCEMCLKKGKLTPAQEVHHIKPLSKAGTHDEKNLMALCSSCHSTITAQEGGRWK